MSPFRRTSGIQATRPGTKGTGRQALQLARRAGVAVSVLALSACMYSFQAGAGFPDDVKTVAILPFEIGPEVTRPELADEVFNQLLREFPRSQGLQPAGEDVADAAVYGTINRYDVSTPSYRATTTGFPEVLQRQVNLTVEVQIVDLVRNEVLWESPGISVQGEFLEESETEDLGRSIAIELLIQRIVDGAQSNW